MFLETTNVKMLKDKFGRQHDYLRISITENCNFRCTYCMPIEDYPFVPQKNMMSKGEIVQIIRLFHSAGVKKVRFTGGEPLMRKDFIEILEGIQDLELSLHLTTNALLLDRYIDDLKRLNLTSINVSIDSLNKEKFKKITHRDFLDKVVSNIKLSIENGFDVRLNTVALKGVNDSEILDLIKFAIELDIPLRFIEFMPFTGNNWDLSKTLTKEEILKTVSLKYKFEAIHSSAQATASNFKIESGGNFGIISTITAPFCDGCNRIRVTADGKIKNCLFGTEEFDLLKSIREEKSNTAIIQESLNKKHQSLGGLSSLNKSEKHLNDKNRSMIRIGG